MVDEEKKKSIQQKLMKFVEKVKEGDVAIIDAGDVEVVKVGNEYIITMPKGKEVFLVHKGSGLTPSVVKKLDEVA